MMGLFSGVVDKVKSVFFPTEKVGAERRQEVFGTTSKTKTAAVIVGVGAVAAVIPPAAIASAGAKVVEKTVKILPMVGKKIGESFIQKPIQTSAAVLIGAPLVVGMISEKPSLLTSLPKSSYETGKKLVSVVEEHPVAAGVVGSVGGGLLLYKAYDKYFGQSKQEKVIETITNVVDKTKDKIKDLPTLPRDKNPELPTLPPSNIPDLPLLPVDAKTPLVPLTPATQVLGKSVGVSSKKKIKKKKPVQTSNQNMRINIFNGFQTNKYI